MATIDEVLEIQNTQGILAAPTDSPSTSAAVPVSYTASLPAIAPSSATPSTLQIALQNNTSSDNLYAYVTGLDINNNNAVWMLQSDGVSAYYPAYPSSDHSPLLADVAIVVGPPGTVRTVTVPQVVGGRIWFCQNSPLTFLLNQGGNGAALVEPSVTNSTDPNYALRWDFCEFTYNTTELFANISYVDFVSIPVALRLDTGDGSASQIIKGMPVDGLDTVCNALQDQQRVDCAGWDQLVVQIWTSSAGTSFLRALSPYNGLVLNNALFVDYFKPYVDSVWEKYQTTAMNVDTQAYWGTVTGQVDSSNQLSFSGVGAFPKPSTADIFSCNTGAFAAYANNTAEMGNIGARLAAALNRSTLLADADQPGSVGIADTYYQNAITNHYARIVHATNLDGLGYAFPYDDVTPNNGVNQSGAVASGSPSLFTVFIGGGDASGPAGATSTTNAARSEPILLRDMNRRGRQLVGGGHRPQHYRRLGRRSLPPPPPAEVALPPPTMAPFTSAAVEVDEKALLKARDEAATTMTTTATTDLEKGQLLVNNAVPFTAPATATMPDLTTRFALLLRQALLYLWAAICGLGRSVWAMVPRPVAAPVGAFFSRVVASPAVTAASASVSSFVSSVANSAAASVVAAVIIRPLVVRAVLTAAVLLATYAATAGGTTAPMLSSFASAVTSWLGPLAGEHAPVALPDTA